MWILRLFNPKLCFFHAMDAGEIIYSGSRWNLASLAKPRPSKQNLAKSGSCRVCTVQESPIWLAASCFFAPLLFSKTPWGNLFCWCASFTTCISRWNRNGASYQSSFCISRGLWYQYLLDEEELGHMYSSFDFVRSFLGISSTWCLQ